jgi:hypothetical protein
MVHIMFITSFTALDWIVNIFPANNFDMALYNRKTVVECETNHAVSLPKIFHILTQ